MNSVNEQYRVNEMETCRTDFSLAAGQYKKLLCRIFSVSIHVFFASKGLFPLHHYSKI